MDTRGMKEVDILREIALKCKKCINLYDTKYNLNCSLCETGLSFHLHPKKLKTCGGGQVCL